MTGKKSSSFSLSVGGAILLTLLLISVSSVVVVKAEHDKQQEPDIIRTNKKCYLRGEPIYVNFINYSSRARENDWVGIYPANTNVNYLTTSDLRMWLWTCGSRGKRCDVGQYSTVKFVDSKNDARANDWPVEHGNYIAVLAKYEEQAPYELIVNSSPFSIEDSCNGLTLSPAAHFGDDDDDDDDGKRMIRNDDDDDNDSNRKSMESRR
mmetsp:Transcript_25961/g.28703  ORF Transcript_25961/g.28703 Transcript_25961/m.28703 type:complete len:208 (-) Transcript_25961:299-922(-)